MLFAQGKGKGEGGWGAIVADSEECILPVSCPYISQELPLDRVYVSVSLQTENQKQNAFALIVKKNPEKHLDYTHLLCRASSHGVCSVAPFQSQ